MLQRVGSWYLLQVPGFWNHEGFCSHGQQVCAVLLPGNALHGFSPPPFSLIEHLRLQQPISVHTRQLQTVLVRCSDIAVLCLGLLAFLCPAETGLAHACCK